MILYGAFEAWKHLSLFIVIAIENVNQQTFAFYTGVDQHKSFGWIIPIYVYNRVSKSIRCRIKLAKQRDPKILQYLKTIN